MLHLQDVLLEAECGYSMQLFNVIDPGRKVPKTYSALLHENGGWIDSRSREPATQLDFLSVLANLRSLKIRGSFYLDAETVRLAFVRIEEGRPGSLNGKLLFPCCSRKRL